MFPLMTTQQPRQTQFPQPTPVQPAGVGTPVFGGVGGGMPMPARAPMPYAGAGMAPGGMPGGGMQGAGPLLAPMGTAIGSVPSAGAVMVMDRLSSHVEECWEAARRWKDTHITPVLEACLRARRGEYDPSKLAAIRAQGGCETYFNLTEAKCRGLESWVGDVMLPMDDRPWDLAPTSIPELPGEVMQGIQQAIVAQFEAEYAQVMAVANAMEAAEPGSGQGLMQELRHRVEDAALTLRDQVMGSVVDEARKRADRMGARVSDILTEGGWHEAFADLIHHLSTYPLAVMKGPILEGRRKMKWDRYGQGSMTVEAVVSFKAVNPWDYFPSPSARRTGQDWACERVEWTLPDLQAAAQSPGWLGPQLQLALSEWVMQRQGPQLVAVQGARNDLERRPDSPQGWTTLVQGIEYWGSVPGEYLLEWAQSNQRALTEFGFLTVRAGEWYAITVCKIGRHIVKLGPNLDPLGRLPYSATSFELVPGSLWGRSVPEVLSDCQEPYTAVLRSMVNNMAFCAAPMLAYDAHAARIDIQRIQPWGVYPYDGSLAPNSREPFKFFQPAPIVQWALAAAQHFSDVADERSGIPKYMQGDTGLSGAGETARGLGMLMSNSAKNVKRVLGHIDRFIQTPCLTRLVDFLNQYGTDPACKGDVRVIPRGALGVLAADMRHVRQQEFLSLAERPRFGAFFQDRGIAETLRTIARTHELPDDVILRDDELAAQQQAQAQAAQAQMMAQRAAAQRGPAQQPATNPLIQQPGGAN